MICLRTFNHGKMLAIRCAEGYLGGRLWTLKEVVFTQGRLVRIGKGCILSLGHDTIQHLPYVILNIYLLVVPFSLSKLSSFQP